MPRSGRAIEFISESADGQWVELTMVESRPWDGSEERRLELETRIHNYLSFVLDGQLHREFPRLARKKVRIVVITSSTPDPPTTWFLDRVAARCRAAGVELRVTVGGPAPE